MLIYFLIYLNFFIILKVKKILKKILLLKLLFKHLILKVYKNGLKL